MVADKGNEVYFSMGVGQCQRELSALLIATIEDAPHDQPKEQNMKPTIGRIVLYKLGEQDASEINRRRTTGADISKRIKQEVAVMERHDGGVGVTMTGSAPVWPLGAQAHIGNSVSAGDVFPMLICRICGETPESAVNGQVFLDGNDTYWATSRVCGDNLGNWSWPTIQK